MEIEITPEPSPEERDAIERALARVPEERAGKRSGWWREGVAENLNPEEERD